jgi:hypothetical protein
MDDPAKRTHNIQPRRFPVRPGADRQVIGREHRHCGERRPLVVHGVDKDRNHPRFTGRVPPQRQFHFLFEQ